LVGYRVIEYETGAKFKIASLEKAVLDYLYFNNWINSADSFTELRWNKQEIIGVIDNSLFSMYLRSFQNSALEQRVNFLREYVHA
jgi:predicted transcriptional regulator of viral defense system